MILTIILSVLSSANKRSCKCSDCNGEGFEEHYNYYDNDVIPIKCKTCNGTGEMNKE